MDAVTLRNILKFIKYCGSWGKPLSEFYAWLDKNTYGIGKFVLFGLCVAGFCYSVIFWVTIGRWLLRALMPLFGFGAKSTTAAPVSETPRAMFPIFEKYTGIYYSQNCCINLI
jgi:hypothetical protein